MEHGLQPPACPAKKKKGESRTLHQLDSQERGSVAWRGELWRFLLCVCTREKERLSHPRTLCCAYTWKVHSGDLCIEGQSHCLETDLLCCLWELQWATHSKLTPDRRDCCCCLPGSGERALQPLLATTVRDKLIRNCLTSYHIAIVLPSGFVDCLKACQQLLGPNV